VREGAETACSWRRSGRSGRPRLPAMSPIARGPIGRPRLKFRRGLCRCFGVGTGARSGPDTETPTTFSISATTAGGAGATTARATRSAACPVRSAASLAGAPKFSATATGTGSSEAAGSSATRRRLSRGRSSPPSAGKRLPVVACDVRSPVASGNSIEVSAGNICEVGLGMAEDGVMESRRPGGALPPCEAYLVAGGEDCVDLEDVRPRECVDIGILSEGGWPGLPAPLPQRMELLSCCSDVQAMQRSSASISWREPLLNSVENYVSRLGRKGMGIVPWPTCAGGSQPWMPGTLW